jgi:hypothetical protein
MELKRRFGSRSVSPLALSIMLVLSSLFAFVTTVPDNAAAGTVSHNVGNLDFELTDYGRILGSLSWMGVRQTPMFQASVPPFGSINDDSWIGLFDDQQAYNQATPDIADSFNELSPAYPAPADDYTVTPSDTAIYFMEDTPTFQQSRASYTNTGTSSDNYDLRVTQTAWSSAGDNFAIIEYKITNIKGGNIQNLEVGFHFYSSMYFYNGIMSAWDFGGVGGDGGDDVDFWDAALDAYYVADNSGSGTALGFASADPSTPLDIYYGNPASMMFPTVVPSDNYLLNSLGGNQLAWPGGCIPDPTFRQCDVESVVGWDVGNLGDGESVVLPLVVAANSNPGLMLTDIVTAQESYIKWSSGIIMTEVQDSSSPSQRIEVFNKGDLTVDLTNWRPWTSSSGFLTGTWTPDPTIAPGEHRVFSVTAGTLGLEGDYVFLYNDVNLVIDDFGYGQGGLAPDPTNGQSSARVWDAALGGYSSNWSMTLPGLSAPTFGSQNNVPDIVTPEFVLNEVCYNPSPQCSGYIELMYKGLGSIDFSLTNHYVVVDSIHTISTGSVDWTRQLYFINEVDYPVNFDMDVATDNIYLYDNLGRLLDMVGWSSPHLQDRTVARSPEGNGTHDGFDDSTSADAGWVFDSLPTYAVISIDRDMHTGGYPGGNVTISLNVTNYKFDTDLVNLDLTQQYGWPFSLLDSSMIPLPDSEPDGRPDVTVGPGSTQMLYLVVSMPDTAMDEINNVTINATSTTTSGQCPPGFDSVVLRIDVYPHVNVTKKAVPSTIYLNGTGISPEETTVTLYLSGRGVPQVRKVPQDVIFILDSSGSMSWNDPDPNGPCNPPVYDPGPPPLNRPARVDAVWKYIDNLTSQDRGGYVDFDAAGTDGQMPNPNDATLRIPLTSDYVRLKQAPYVPATGEAGVWCANQAGGTLINAGINVANQELINNGDPSHILVEILLTDAEQTPAFDDSLARSYADFAAQNGIVIFTIGLNVVQQGPPGGIDLLNYIATTTGGQYYPAADASTLVDIYKEIGLSIKDLAAVDPNPGDPQAPVIVDITQSYLDVNMSTINPGAPPVFLDATVNPDGTTSIKWKLDQLAIGETRQFSYNVRSNLGGNGLSVTDWPKAFVNYLRWDNTSNNMTIPSAFIDVIAPDLIPTNVLVDNSPAPIPPVPVLISDFDTVNISAMATNIGTGDVPVPFNMTFFNCTSSGIPTGDPPFLEVSIPGVPVGGFSQAYFEFWTEPGLQTIYYVCIKVDSDMEINELNETNNVRIIKIEVVPPILSDLIPGDPTSPDGIYVDGVQVPDSDGVSPSDIVYVDVNANVEISSNVSNVGPGNATDFEVTFYLSDTGCTGGSVLDTWTVAGGLLTGTTTGPFTTFWNAPPVADEVWINITVDSQLDVTEENELNNSYCIHIIVVEPPPGEPDLIPFDGNEIRINDDPYSPPPTGNISIDLATGQRINLRSVVRNVGNLSTDSPYAFKIFINMTSSAFPNTLNPIYSNQFSTALDPMMQTSLQYADWSAFLVPGKYYLFFHADPILNNDSNLMNNTLVVEVNVYTLPEPPSPWLYADHSTGSIIIGWNRVDNDDIQGYRIYWANSTDELDFSLLQATVWTNSDPIAFLHNNGIGLSKEVYYSVRSVDVRGWEGPSSYIVGKHTMTFPRDYSTFALPLEPFETRMASWYALDMPSSFLGAIFGYDYSSQLWVGHAKEVHQGVDDFPLVMGEGYMLYTHEEFNYTFVGRPGTTVRFLDGAQNDPHIGTEKEFRNSLSLEVVPEGLKLEWNATQPVDLGTLFQPYESVSYYNIYRALNRTGFDFLNPYASTSDTFFIDTAVQDDEYYYMVIPANAMGREGSGTFSIGIVMLSHSSGYSTMGLPLKMEGNEMASWYIAGADNASSIFYYDLATGRWVGHAREVPEWVDNTDLVLGDGYIIYVYDVLKVAVIGR